MGLFRGMRPSAPKVIGMIHILPTPGSAGFKGRMAPLLQRAIKDADTYLEAGIDALLIENMHDVPYLRGAVEPETTAAMAVVASAVKQLAGDLPVGIQVLAGANREALGVAVAANLQFLRVEAFAYAHVADEGLLEACAAPLLRARARLHADAIEVLADIKKKHSSHAITGDLSLLEVAEGTEFCKADGLIITGLSTGRAPSPDAVREVKGRTRLPVLVGSGVTAENACNFLESDGLIVGSYLKADGDWRLPVDGARVRELLRALGR